MKEHVAKVAWLAFALVGATVPSASAAISTTHAAAFHAYNASQVADIDYVPGAVYNKATGVRPVIAPVTFVPEYGFGPATAFFWVDGTVAPGTTPFSWTMYAYDYNGVFVTSTTRTKSSSGTFDTHTELLNVDVNDYISCFAQMPANTGTRFFGILSAN